MNKLKQMGIQQWRRRVVADSPATSQELSAPDPTPESVEPVLEDRTEAPVLTEVANSVVVADLAPTLAPEPEPELSWESLAQSLLSDSGCQHCAATDPILGAGDQSAECVFIIAMPSANDLQRQQLLSGRDGQLFDAMLSAMKLTREQVYLTSACKCVIADESSNTRPCIQLVHQQLALVQPKVIISFGQQAAQWVIKSNENLPVLRSKAQKCHSTDVPVVVTHDLPQLLIKPSLKAEAWQDLRRAIRLLN